MSTSPQIIDHDTGQIISDDHALVPLSEVETFLAARPPVETAKELRDRLAALCTYYKGKVDVYNELYEGQLRTERYIGQALADKPPVRLNQYTEVPPNTVLGGTSSTPTYKELGFSDMQSSRLQKLASVPEDKFNGYIAARKDAAERIVKADLLADAFERQVQEAEFKGQQIRIITGSSESNEWYTPQWIIDLVRETMGGIDLDPASCPDAQAVIQAEAYYGFDDDGFNQPWFGRVWLNPPYGASGEGAAGWALKLIREYKIGQVTAAVLLVKAAFGYNWFNDLWYTYPTCILRERVTFVSPVDGIARGPAKHATALIYLGETVDTFRGAFRPYGRIILPDDNDTTP